MVDCVDRVGLSIVVASVVGVQWFNGGAAVAWVKVAG
jgi:hypothetical protein